MKMYGSWNEKFPEISIRLQDGKLDFFTNAAVRLRFDLSKLFTDP